MQVAMYYNNQDVRLEEMPEPGISADELLVRVKASGICGSDVLEWYRLKKAPLVLGHEITGEIEEVGKNVLNYKKGQRVFVSHHVPCNTCRYCLRGFHTVCETLHTTNYYPGGFSQFIRVPKINVERGVFVLPDEISFEEGTFIEPLACVVRAQEMIKPLVGQSVLILGAGISGLLHLLLAKADAASRIILADLDGYRLNQAEKFGADAVINAQKDLPVELRGVNENRLADVVIVCTGAQQAFLQSLKCVERAGSILNFAATLPGQSIPIPVNDFWRQSIKIMHSYGAAPVDILKAIELLRSKTIKVKNLITHKLRLDEAGLGFRLVSSAKDCLKVIIQP
jgi:L-iditol 2-dehydrogenase